MGDFKPEVAEYAYLDPSIEPAKSLFEVGREVGVDGEILRSCAKRGRKDMGGTIHHLEVCRLPGGLGSSKEAYIRFLRKINRLP